MQRPESHRAKEACQEGLELLEHEEGREAREAKRLRG
jgi:hypothetical protein